jgi:F0F1-type ATP synthase membrane subunit b/b'
MIEFNATFIVAMLSFAVFILIMNAIFYNPILNMIRTREEYINSNYEDSKKLEASAEEFKQTHAQKIKETQDKCRQEFKEHINEVQTIATSEIRNARENSKMEIQNRKDKLYEKESVLNKELKDTVAKNLAQEITKKLTGGITG